MHLSAGILRISTREGFITAFRLALPSHLLWVSLGLLWAELQLKRVSRMWIDPFINSCHQDCFNRPIVSAPSNWIDVVERVSYDSNKTLQYVNFLIPY
jgi:hypothetical protein